MKKSWTHVATENFSYKVVALFISLILWLTILGRRDFVLSKSIEIDLITAPGHTVVAQTADQIKVKVSGPRTALKKFIDGAFSQSIAVDLTSRGDGILDVEIPLNRIEVPMGVKILSVRPSIIRAEVTHGTKENGKESAKENGPAERKEKNQHEQKHER